MAGRRSKEAAATGKAATEKERIRISRACAACIARKVKCDGTPSCETCRSTGVPCFYLPVTRKRGPPKGCPARGGIRKKTKAAEEATATATEEGQGGGSGSGSGEKNAERLPSAVAAPQTAIASTSTAHVAPAMLMRSDHAALQAALEQPLDHLFDGDDGALPAEWTDDPMPTAQASASASAAPPPFAAPVVEDRPGRWLPDATVESLLLIYETFIHPHWPMVYMPALRSLRTLDTQSPLLFDAILAISAANCDTKRDVDDAGAYGDVGSTHRRDMAMASSSSGASATLGGGGDTHDALVALSEEMLESVRRRVFARGLDKGEVATVQALILVSLVDLGYGRSSLAYQMGGMASRMACDMGLNMIGTGAAAVAATSSARRTPLRGVTPTPTPPRRLAAAASAGMEERKRTIWACYTLDKVLSAILQRPVALRAADIATPRPSELERDELDLLMVGTAQQRFLHASACAEMDYVKSHALSTFNAWCDVMVIVESTLDKLYVPAAYNARVRAATGRSTGHATALEDQERFVAQIDGALATWRATLPVHLQWSHDDDDDVDDEWAEVEQHTFVPAHILTVRGWYLTCKILVHRPRVPHLYYQTIITSPRAGGGGGEYGRHGRASNAHSDVDAVEALRLLKQATPNGGSVRHAHFAASSQKTAATTTVPNGLDAARNAATSLCNLMEAYEKTFRVRKFPSSWVYLIFQAGTVHAGLALPSSKSQPPSPMLGGRVQHQHERASMHLDQCIRWLDQIALTWVSAGHHVQLLRRLSEVGAHTRPLRPRGQRSAPDTGVAAAGTPRDDTIDGAAAVANALAMVNTNNAATYTSLMDHSAIASGGGGADSMLSPSHQQQDLLDSWSLFWGIMPTTSEDVSLWQDFSGLFQ